MDYEIQGECERAEWELVDYVNGFMMDARTTFIPNANNVTEQDVINIAALTYSLEVERYVPDCSTGLYTETALNKKHWVAWELDYIYIRDETERKERSVTLPVTRGMCMSHQLLDECETARDGIPEYMNSIKRNIRVSDATQEFKDYVIYRINNSVQPAISCKTVEYIEDEVVDSASATAVSVTIVAITLVVSTFLL